MGGNGGGGGPKTCLACISRDCETLGEGGGGRVQKGNLLHFEQKQRQKVAPAGGVGDDDDETFFNLLKRLRRTGASTAT